MEPTGTCLNSREHQQADIARQVRDSDPALRLRERRQPRYR